VCVCVYVCVCKCVFMCLCVRYVCVCVYMCMCVCVCVCVHWSVCVCVYFCVRLYVCVRVYSCVCVCVYVCVCVCLCVYVRVTVCANDRDCSYLPLSLPLHTHTVTYKSTHACTCVYTCVCVCVCVNTEFHFCILAHQIWDARDYLPGRARTPTSLCCTAVSELQVLSAVRPGPRGDPSTHTQIYSCIYSHLPGTELAMENADSINLKTTIYCHAVSMNLATTVEYEGFQSLILHAHSRGTQSFQDSLLARYT